MYLAPKNQYVRFNLRFITSQICKMYAASFIHWPLEIHKIAVSC